MNWALPFRDRQELTPLLTSRSVRPCVVGSEGSNMEMFFDETPVSDEVCRKKVENDAIEAVRDAVAQEIALQTECFIAREGIVMRMYRGKIQQLMH